MKLFLKKVLNAIMLTVGIVALFALLIFVVSAVNNVSDKIEKDMAEETCKPYKVLTRYEYDGKKFVVCLGHEVREVKK